MSRFALAPRSVGLCSSALVIVLFLAEFVLRCCSQAHGIVFPIRDVLAELHARCLSARSGLIQLASRCPSAAKGRSSRIRRHAGSMRGAALLQHAAAPVRKTRNRERNVRSTAAYAGSRFAAAAPEFGYRRTAPPDRPRPRASPDQATA